MLGEEGKDRGVPAGHRKQFLRSASWSDRSPSKPNPRSLPNSKVRSCLPPLQPLSISRRSVEEWPRPGSDDLGEWPHPPTPGPGRSSVKPLENYDPSDRPPPREFRLRKEDLAFFDKECSRIIDHIYLGSEAVARNREVLRQNGITHVLNCVGFACPEYFKNDLVYKTLWLQDSPSEDITSILYDVFDYFEDVREQGGRVLVHCFQGVSRSTSLVIAYLMWRNLQSFEDAFQYVKAARGITNPNMGFACQLLQCQKRVLAVPASPSSVLRVYRMAPHSPYDPLHLVPKMLIHPCPLALDSRGTFIVHLPSVIYIWIGQDCNQVMSNHARAAAFQVVRYERAQGPIVTVEEGKEPSEFWDALASAPLLVDDRKAKEEVSGVAGKDQVAAAISLGVGNKKVGEYDVDYQIFQKALCGGVVPPFSSSVSGSETHLPARENGWGRLRRKFASGVVKELVTSSKLTYENAKSDNRPDEIMLDSCIEVEQPVPPTDPLLSPSPPSCSPDSFSCNLNTSSKVNSKSPSPSPLPSPSDSSSWFTFSPASSNWSNLSFLSSQPSPSSLEFTEMSADKNSSQAEKACLPCKGTSPSPAGLFAATHALRVEKACLPCKGTSPSLAERRGSNPPTLVLSPAVHNPSQVSRNIVRSYSFSLSEFEEDMMQGCGFNQFDCEGFHEKEPMSHPDLFGANNEIQAAMEDQKEFCNLPSNESIDMDVELSHPILYKWPSMEKVEMHCFGILDSRSVFLLLAPDAKLGKNKPKVLYVWVGHDVSCEKGQSQLIYIDRTFKDSYAYWEKIGCIFLSQRGLPMDVPIQVVREGEEPQQLMDHLNHFHFNKRESNTAATTEK